MVRIKAVDVSGLETVVSLVFDVDTQAPIVAILSPHNGSKVHGTVRISWMIVEPHVASVTLVIDGTSIDVTNRTFYDWDTTKVSNGLHTIKLIVRDVLGRESVSVVTIVVANIERVATYAAIPVAFLVGFIPTLLYFRRKLAGK